MAIRLCPDILAPLFIAVFLLSHEASGVGQTIDPRQLEHADADPDGDGVSNLEEYRLGTSPIMSNGCYMISPAKTPCVIHAEKGTSFTARIPIVNLSYTSVTCTVSAAEQAWCVFTGWRTLRPILIGQRTPVARRMEERERKVPLEHREQYIFATHLLRCGMRYVAPLAIDTTDLQDNSTYYTAIRALAPVGLQVNTNVRPFRVKITEGSFVYTNIIPVVLKIGSHPDRAHAPMVPRLLSPPDGTIHLHARDNEFSWEAPLNHGGGDITYSFRCGSQLETQLVNQTRFKLPMLPFGEWYNWRVTALATNGLSTQSETWGCAGPSNLPVFRTTLTNHTLWFDEVTPEHIFSVTNSGQGFMMWNVDAVSRWRAPYVRAERERRYDIFGGFNKESVVTLAMNNAVVAFEEKWRLTAWLAGVSTQIDFICAGSFPTALAKEDGWLITPSDNSHDVPLEAKLTWEHPGLPYDAILADWELRLGPVDEPADRHPYAGTALNPPLFTNGISQYCTARLLPGKTYCWYATTTLTALNHIAVCATPLSVFTTTASNECPELKSPRRAPPAKPKNLGWNEETVRYFMGRLKKDERYSYYDKRYAHIVTNAALSTNTPVPRDVIQFAAAVLDLPATNDDERAFAFEMLHNTTDEIVGGLLLARHTNYYLTALASRDGSSKRMLECKAYSCRRGLESIGTPEIIDKLNRVYRQLSDKGIEVDQRVFTISPDRHPEEAAEWLLHHTDSRVRKSMLYKWRESSRAETPGVLDKYILQMEATPTNSMNASTLDSHLSEIENLQKTRDQFARAYHRWVLDDRRKPLHYGCYNDGAWIRHRQKRLQQEK